MNRRPADADDLYYFAGQANQHRAVYYVFGAEEMARHQNVLAASKVMVARLKDAFGIPGQYPSGIRGECEMLDLALQHSEVQGAGANVEDALSALAAVLDTWRNLLNDGSESEGLQTLAEGIRGASDEVYQERNRLVAALTTVYSAHLMTHDGDEWSEDWRTVVCVELPTGQVTWHIHTDDRPLFAHLEERPENDWDGHDTDEKYRRLAALSCLRGTRMSSKRRAAFIEGWESGKGYVVGIAPDKRADIDPFANYTACGAESKAGGGVMAHLWNLGYTSGLLDTVEELADGDSPSIVRGMG